MNKTLKTTLIIIGILIVLGSVVLNLYSIVWKGIENGLMQKGFNVALSQVIQQVQQTGQVQLGDLILIKKP